MRKIIFLILAAQLMPGTSLAQDAECAFAEEVIDPATSVKTISTRWWPMTSVIAPVKGAIRGVSQGDSKFLAVRMTAHTFYPLPADLDISAEDTELITKHGKYDARLNPFIEKLQNESFFVPGGSTLRITLEDQTTVVVRTVADYKVRSNVDRPRWNSNGSSHFRVRVTAEPRYLLDTEALHVLTAKPAINMRLESQDRYYTFGHRQPFASRHPFMTPLSWSEKTNLTIQKAINCVL